MQPARRAVPVRFFQEGLTSGQMRRNVWMLAWPSVGRLVLQTMVGVVTMMSIGSLGPAALAGVGIGNLIVFIMIGVLSALSVGATALVARRVGAGQFEAAEEVLRQSLAAGLLVSAVLSPAVYLSAPFIVRALLWGNHDPQVIEVGTTYLHWLSLSMIVGVWLFMINGALEGAGDTRTPLYLMIVTNLVNLVGVVGLVHGLGPLPRLGITGAAAAGAVSRVIGAGLALAYVSSRYSVLQLHWRRRWRLDSLTIREILDIGLPSSGEQLVRQSAQVIYTVFVASLGTVVMAAQQITANVNSLAMLPGMGFAVASTTLVGQSLGAGHPEAAQRYATVTNQMGTILMASIAALFSLFAPHLVRLYTQNPQVVTLATTTVRIVALASIPFGVVIITSGSLRGAGDTRFVMGATAAGQFGIRLLFTFLLGVGLGWGLNGLWYAMLIDVAIRSLLMLWRFRSGVWKQVYERQEARYHQVAPAAAAAGARLPLEADPSEPSR